MNPSIETRIGSMIRSLSECILPELDPAGAAAEQAALLIGHLTVLEQQLDLAADFDRYEADCQDRLATALLAEVEGGAAVTAAAESLRERLAGEHTGHPREARHRAGELGARIEELIRAAGVDGTPAFQERSRQLVIASERPRMAANRAYFAGMNWEAPETELPDLGAMLFAR